jgi:hypothetical protein
MSKLPPIESNDALRKRALDGEVHGALIIAIDPSKALDLITRLEKAEAEVAALRESETQRNTQIVRLIAERAAAERKTWEKALEIADGLHIEGYDPDDPLPWDEALMELEAAIRAAMEETQ